mmetsp:Transcript_28339/g.90667  ORF Transcript_28339/g.90667 Transcript_28339/m.90667 type:complete len:83 (-) Transcript_28339:3824-4072(-)
MSQFQDNADGPGGGGGGGAVDAQRLQAFIEANNAARQRYAAATAESRARLAEVEGEVEAASGGAVTLAQLVAEHQGNDNLSE